jgi:hypothetical protein
MLTIFKNKIKFILNKLIGSIFFVGKIEDISNEEHKKMLAAKAILNSFKFNSLTVKKNNLQDYEFKVFSQFGDDGIIQFLVNYLDISVKKFIEFGVTDYAESNTRFLLLNNNWEGMVMDGSNDEINKIKNAYYYWQHNLKAKMLWVTKDNIDKFIVSEGFTGEIGLLHIDLDGNDYWVWDSIKSISPIIFIAEYNSVFGLNPWTIEYNESFQRTKYHYSNLYWGSSLSSLIDLSLSKGYAFIGCNSAGNNAYFIKRDKMKDIKELTLEEGFVDSKYRESRDNEGKLSYLSGPDRLLCLKGLPIYNTKLKKIEKI